MLPRLMVVWVAIAATALSAGVFLALADIEIMQAGITAFAFAAATFFPALLLAIWWRRCSRLGAMLALGFGFAVMLPRSLSAARWSPDNSASPPSPQPDRRRAWR